MVDERSCCCSRVFSKDPHSAVFHAAHRGTMGRRSFMSFNTSVDKYVASAARSVARQTGAEEVAREEVTADDMAERYEKYIGLPKRGPAGGGGKGGPKAGKRRNSSGKPPGKRRKNDLVTSTMAVYGRR